MPKKSKGSKSKRQTLKDKHKIIRKVKEHNRKKRREAKKHDKKKPSLLKDPGIPNNFPYREQVVKEFKFEQQRIQAVEAAKKDARKQRKAARQAGADGTAAEGDADMAEEPAAQLEALRNLAAHSQAQFSERVASDKTRKGYYKEFKKVVSLADVIVEVLDARDPLSCRCLDIEKYIRSVDANKKIVLVLNKVDLVPQEVAQQWLTYFRQELPTIAFKAATKKSGTIAQGKLPARARAAAAEGSDTGASGLLATSECLGADALVHLLKNYTRNAGIKTAVTVGVVGMPNVGKSSLINSLKRSRVAAVGNTPGVTTGVQEVQLDKSIRLLDSPGVVFAAADDDAAAALRNAVKVERLQDPVAPVATILERVPAKRLMQIYRIGAFDSAESMLAQIASARGKLRKGGVPDVQIAARLVLQDWNDGRIPFFTRPPSRGHEAEESVQLVAEYAAAFDADAVFRDADSAVVAGLPAEQEGSFVEAQRGHVVQVDLQALEAADTATQAPTAAEPEEESDMEDMYDDPPTVPAAAPVDKQNEVLYSEIGQHNPKKARAAKKAKKRAVARLVNSADAYDPAILSDEDMTE